jgi:lysosomal acid lipase/cholesteryl ester hydrolase
MEIYGQPNPPDYNTTELKNFNFTSYIVAGDSDPFVQKSDFDLFLSLINLEGKTVSFLKNYNHLDYVWAQNAREDIYIPLIDFLNR